MADIWLQGTLLSVLLYSTLSLNLTFTPLFLHLHGIAYALNLLPQLSTFITTLRHTKTTVSYNECIDRMPVC